MPQEAEITFVEVEHDIEQYLDLRPTATTTIVTHNQPLNAWRKEKVSFAMKTGDYKDMRYDYSTRTSIATPVNSSENLPTPGTIT